MAIFPVLQKLTHMYIHIRNVYYTYFFSNKWYFSNTMCMQKYPVGQKFWFKPGFLLARRKIIFLSFPNKDFWENQLSYFFYSQKRCQHHSMELTWNMGVAEMYRVGFFSSIQYLRPKSKQCRSLVHSCFWFMKVKATGKTTSEGIAWGGILR